MNNIVASGSSAWKMMEEEGLLAKGWVAATHGAYYRLMEQEGSAQFRYWLSENKHDTKKILSFFNFQNTNKLAAESHKIALPSIKTNQIIYVPMLVKTFDLAEAETYDKLNNKRFFGTRSNSEKVEAQGTKFHTNASLFDSSTHVKVRLLYDTSMAVSFKDGSINRAKLRESRGSGKIIIHFHGGGFMC